MKSKLLDARINGVEDPKDNDSEVDLVIEFVDIMDDESRNRQLWHIPEDVGFRGGECRTAFYLRCESG